MIVSNGRAILTSRQAREAQALQQVRAKSESDWKWSERLRHAEHNAKASAKFAVQPVIARTAEHANILANLTSVQERVASLAQWIEQKPAQHKYTETPLRGTQRLGKNIARYLLVNREGVAIGDSDDAFFVSNIAAQRPGYRVFDLIAFHGAERRDLANALARQVGFSTRAISAEIPPPPKPPKPSDDRPFEVKYAELIILVHQVIAEAKLPLTAAEFAELTPYAEQLAASSWNAFTDLILELSMLSYTAVEEATPQFNKTGQFLHLNWEPYAEYESPAEALEAVLLHNELADPMTFPDGRKLDLPRFKTARAEVTE